LRFGIKNNAPAHAGNDRFIRRDNVGYPARVRAPKVDFAPPPRCDIRPGRKPYADDGFMRGDGIDGGAGLSGFGFVVGPGAGAAVRSPDCGAGAGGFGAGRLNLNGQNGK